MGWRKDVFWLTLSVLRGTGGLRCHQFRDILHLKYESFKADAFTHRDVKYFSLTCSPHPTSTAVCPWKKHPHNQTWGTDMLFTVNHKIGNQIHPTTLVQKMGVKWLDLCIRCKCSLINLPLYIMLLILIKTILTRKPENRLWFWQDNCWRFNKPIEHEQS